MRRISASGACVHSSRHGRHLHVVYFHLPSFDLEHAPICHHFCPLREVRSYCRHRIRTVVAFPMHMPYTPSRAVCQQSYRRVMDRRVPGLIYAHAVAQLFCHHHRVSDNLNARQGVLTDVLRRPQYCHPLAVVICVPIGDMHTNARVDVLRPVQTAGARDMRARLPCLFLLHPGTISVANFPVATVIPQPVGPGLGEPPPHHT